MMNILINVVNQKLKVVKNISNLISGTQRFICFKFLLDSGWDGLTIFAQFIQNGRAYNDFLDKNNCVYLPPEIVAGEFKLLLYGSGSNVIATTNYLTLKVDENAIIADAQSTEISQSLYDQLVTLVKNIGDNIDIITGGTLVDNLIDPELLYTGTESGVTITRDGDTLIFNGTSTSKGRVLSENLGLEPQKEYIVKVHSESKNQIQFFLAYVGDTASTTKLYTEYNTAITFTVPSGTTSSAFGIQIPSGVTYSNDKFRITIRYATSSAVDTVARASLDAMTTALSTDVGKVLKVKTVTNGKVTEWEFGEFSTYVTPEAYGAVGDGTTDDSQAIQNAIDSGQTVNFSRKTYMIHSPIVINDKTNWSMNAQDATFIYDGSDYALRILQATNCNINIGTVRASNGGGIKFYSSGGNSFNQYISLTFNIIECKTNCIQSYAEDNGWCNDNRVFGGRFMSGENGAYISHASGNATDGWKFYNCGIEGVTNGFLFDAGESLEGRINSISIINPRYAESYETILKTIGFVFDCLWVGTHVVRPSEIECSEDTSRFEIYAPINTIWDGDLIRHRGCIIDGELVAETTIYDGEALMSLDSTLTVEGAAADAKAVGDKINGIFTEEATNNLFDKNDIVAGSYINPYTGEIVEYTDTFHAFIEFSEGSYTYLAQHGVFGTNAFIAPIFDENYNFVSYTEGEYTALDGTTSTVTVTFSTQATNIGKYFSVNGTTDITNTLMVVKGNQYPTQYIPYGSYKTIDGLQISKSQIVDLGEDSNPLNGKIISLNGDSISAGAGYAGGYGKIIAEENGMVYENISIGGGCVAYIDENVHCISRTIGNMREDADYVILDGGGNDADVGVPIGTISTGYDATLDDTTFAGAFESMLKSAINRFPDKKIGYVFIHKCAYAFDSRVENSYYGIAKSACEKWGIPYIDLNTQTPPIGYIASLKNAYTSNGDGYHLNEEGYNIFYVPKITAWLKTL